MQLILRAPFDQRAAHFSGDVVEPNADAIVSSFLMPAMREAVPLVMEHPTSQRLTENNPALQRVLAEWWPKYRIVPFETQTWAGGARAEGVGAFFTGGVDSFYTAIRNLDRITHLIYVHGFDVGLENRQLRERVGGSLREAAQALAKPLIEIETDLKLIGTATSRPAFGGIHWEEYHGAALTAVGHLCASVVGTVLIPGTLPHASLGPWGSHPALDHLWSSERVQFVHEGAHATRLQKTEYIARSEIALAHLRVCWQHDPQRPYNCGRCAKCVRTMTALRIFGALERCDTLPSLDPELVRRMVPQTRNEVCRVRENLAAAQDRDPQIASALRSSLRRASIAVPARDSVRAAKRFAKRRIERMLGGG